MVTAKVVPAYLMPAQGGGRVLPLGCTCVCWLPKFHPSLQHHTKSHTAAPGGATSAEQGPHTETGTGTLRAAREPARACLRAAAHPLHPTCVGAVHCRHGKDGGINGRCLQPCIQLRGQQVGCDEPVRAGLAALKARVHERTAATLHKPEVAVLANTQASSPRRLWLDQPGTRPTRPERSSGRPGSWSHSPPELML